MPLDQSFEGRVHPPTARYEVGREKIREFAEAVGDTHPAYTERQAAKALGHPDVIAPPTFAFVLTFKAVRQIVDDPRLGFDYSRVVHSSQRFEYTRPVRAGDSLAVTSTVESVGTLVGNDVVEIRGDVHDGAGEHVVTAWTKLVSRATDEEG